ncbi:MAG: hypothetical protein L0220_08000 [Acidobacteria bacterium]|nr:hypothetical protein [Acidobacteriota bacterium]
MISEEKRAQAEFILGLLNQIETTTKELQEKEGWQEIKSYIEDRRSKVLRIGDKDIDFAKAIPLKVRDWRALKAAGVDLVKGIDALDIEMLIAVVTYLVHKVDPSIGEDAILDLSTQNLIRIFRLINDGGQADIPF